MRQLRMRIAVSVLVVIGAAPLAGEPNPEHPLDRQLKKLSPEGVDCGRVDLSGAGREQASACVTEHFLAGRSFRARYQCLSDDSECWRGLALSKRPGRLAVVLFDGIGCGHPPAPYCGTHIQHCRDAKLIPVGDRLTIRCVREFSL